MENYYYSLSLPAPGAVVDLCATHALLELSRCVATVTGNTSKYCACNLACAFIVFRLSGGAIWMRDERRTNGCERER